MKFNLQQLRIETGSNCPILNSDYSKYQPLLLTQSYIRSTWQFMSKHNITLTDNTYTIPLLQEKDSCLMDDFRSNPLIGEELLPLLNRCRLFLKVFTLSDITEGNGTHIRTEAWHGVQFDGGRDTSKWPLWGKPSPLCWTKWRTALQSTYCLNSSRQLRCTLGHWTHIPTTWKWFNANVNGSTILLKHENNKWYCYKTAGRSRLQQRFYKLRKDIDINQFENLLPTTVRQFGKYYIMSNTHNLQVVTSETNNDKEQLSPTPWLNVDKLHKGSQSAIKHAIINHTAVAVSDGSYSEGLGVGTASWVLST